MHHEQNQENSLSSNELTEVISTRTPSPRDNKLKRRRTASIVERFARSLPVEADRIHHAALANLDGQYKPENILSEFNSRISPSTDACRSKPIPRTRFESRISNLYILRVFPRTPCTAFCSLAESGSDRRGDVQWDFRLHSWNYYAWKPDSDDRLHFAWPLQFRGPGMPHEELY